MLRLKYFWRSLPLSAKLQGLALLLVLGYAFISNDLNPKIQIFGIPLWQVTAPIICGSVVLGRLLLPIMMRNPQRTEKVLSGMGLLVFGLWIYSTIERPRLLITYMGVELGMWFDASCWFWFISEIRLREAAFLQRWQNEPAEDLEEDEKGFEG